MKYWLPVGITYKMLVPLQIHRNPPRPLIQDLDQVPFPDRDLSEHLKPYRRFRTMHTVITGRGCPYDCTYCFNHAYMDIYGNAWRKVRRRSVDDVVAEAQELKAEGTTFINFVDDTFIVMKPWIEEFSPRFALEVGLRFSANVRANLVNDDLIHLLREAGCHSVTMGVETADPRLRNEVLKRYMSIEQIVEAAEIVRRHGILLYTSNIVGIPTGSLEADMETLRLNVQLKPYASSAGLLQPYPGTQIREFAEERGLIGTTVDDIPLTLFHETVIKMEPAERRQVENLSHLFNANEILGAVLTTVHNVRFYQRMMEAARDAILAGRYDAFRAEFLSEYGGSARAESEA